MKPIENIFGFDCVTCEHNRHCYGGNMGNQFRYCQKSTEKIQNLDNLEKQNKQLSKEIDTLKKKYENAVADYEKTRFEKEQLNSLVNSCQEEIRQLKKQLENKYEKVGVLTGELLYEENTKLINQQKEFIKYLENMLDDENDIFSVIRVKDVLQKYKEIIGVSNEY